jgi:pyruvate/2-oxoglutarate dehydrogenase complex dihydrolipoamide dehydrogenase (E3) component
MKRLLKDPAGCFGLGEWDDTHFPFHPWLEEEFLLYGRGSLDPKSEENEILILGGGLVGCEVAEFLEAKGKKVILFEILQELGMDMEPYVTRKLLLRRIFEKKLEIHTSTEIYQIEGGKALYRDQEGREGFSHFEAIVLAVGFSPDDGLMKSIEPLGLETYRIGDCITPRGIFEAIHEGSMVGRII